MKIKLFFLIVISLLSACLWGQELRLTEEKSDKGPDIIYIRSEEEEYTGISVFVRLGESLPGLAHLGEHLVFASNSKMKGGDFDFICENMGATCDAYTNYDYSVYKTVIKNAYLPHFIESLSYALLTPEPTQEEFDREKDIIKDEFSGREILGFDYIRHLLQKGLYGNSCLGEPIEGNDIRGLTLEELKNFYRENYISKNMVFVICGNADQEETGKCIRKYFPETDRKVYDVPPKITLKTANTDIKGNRSYFGIMFSLAPSYLIKDAIICDVISQLADDIAFNEVSRKYSYKKEYVHNTGKYASPFCLIYEGEDTDYIKHSLTYAIDCIKNGNFDDYDIKLAKSRILSDYLSKNTKTDQVTYNTGFNYVIYDWKTVYSYDAYINSVTKEDITETAKKYMVSYSSVLCEKE